MQCIYINEDNPSNRNVDKISQIEIRGMQRLELNMESNVESVYVSAVKLFYQHISSWEPVKYQFYWSVKYSKLPSRKRLAGVGKD